MPNLEKVPEFWSEERLDEHLRKIGFTLNRVLEGAHNHAVSVTLTADATSTDYEDPRISAETVPTVTPCSASAAGAITHVTLTRGKLTLHHDASPATDRVVGVAFHGA